MDFSHCGRPVLIIVALLWATGCAHYQPRPLHPEKRAENFDQRTLQDPDLTAYLERNIPETRPEGGPLEWDLRRLTLVALYYHPDLDVARAQWGVAQAGSLTAGQRPNPTLGISPAFNTSESIPSPWIVNPALDLPLETAGKRGYRLAQASQISEVARLNIASVAWKVRHQLYGSLVNLSSAQKMERLLKDQEVIQEEILGLKDQQFQSGAITIFELTTARLALSQARLAWRDAEQKRVEARAGLAEALGLPLAALAGIDFSLENLAKPPSQTDLAILRRQALVNRSDLLAALAEYAASEAALQFEIAKQFPDVHLNPGYEYDQGDNKWSLGLTVELPLLNRNQGPIAEAEARRAQSAAQFDALQTQVLAQIDRAAASYEISLQKVSDLDALLDNLGQQRQSAKALLEAGEISRADLAALRLQINSAELARMESLTAAQHTLGQLEEALQSPLFLAPDLWQESHRAKPAS